MYNRIEKITSLIICESLEISATVKRFTENLILLDNQITKVVVTFPGGFEDKQVLSFRLGDYFHKIELSEDHLISLVFHIKESTSSFWKDLVVAILEKIRKSSPGIQTTIVNPFTVVKI